MALDTSRLNSDRARRRLRWAVPVVAAGAVAVGTVIISAGPSSATPTLPHRTAAQLLTKVQTSAASHFSGVVRESAALGLPQLPGGESGASFSWQNFITGAHSAKVWVDGADRQRVAVLGQLSEADAVHNGRNVWTYTSDTNTATHSVLPADKKDSSSSADHTYNPATAAADLLRFVGRSTQVSVDNAQYVAGRPAYTLVLRPKDARSTVREVTISVDATKWVPLRVQVFGVGSAPALQLGFTRISYSTPPASRFNFRIPSGAAISSNPFGGSQRSRHFAGRRPAGPNAAAAPTSSQHTSTLGSGWTTVLEVPSSAAGGNLGGLVHDATTPLGNGARLLHTALLNAVLMPDGRVFAGAVTPAYLEHVAATAH